MISRTGDREADRTEGADRDDGGDIEIDWIGSVGAGDHFVVSWELSGRELSALSGYHLRP